MAKGKEINRTQTLEMPIDHCGISFEISEGSGEAGALITDSAVMLGADTPESDAPGAYLALLDAISSGEGEGTLPASTGGEVLEEAGASLSTDQQHPTEESNEYDEQFDSDSVNDTISVHSASDGSAGGEGGVVDVFHGDAFGCGTPLSGIAEGNEGEEE